MAKLKTKAQFLAKIEDDCFIRNSDGTAIGSTSGGFSPLFYHSDEDNIGTLIQSWDKAYELYIEHNTKRSLSSELLRYGKILKVNNFNTDRGYYTIRLIDYKKAIYFHKMKDGKVVEIKKFKA